MILLACEGEHMKKLWKNCLIALIVTVWALAVSANGTAAAPCAVDLNSCPAHGCAKPGTSDALVNQIKRTLPPSGALVLLTLDDFESFQEQADILVGQNVNISKVKRNKLKNLKLVSSVKKISEGDLVQVIGFMVGLPNRPKASGPESVNCRLPGKANNDYHIPIAGHPDDSELEAIVVEMIPQDRPKSWTDSKLRRVAKKQLPVLVRGQFFYDNKHVVNSDPDDIKPGQPKRFSLWEIHPVTEFYVCLKVGTNCDPKDIAQWEPLEKVEN
jgi:hypothetical protein